MSPGKYEITLVPGWMTGGLCIVLTAPDNRRAWSWVIFLFFWRGVVGVVAGGGYALLLLLGMVPS